MIHIPFNNDPTSVDVKTSSYTIPSGSYAYVTAQVADGGTFTIDSTTALDSTSGSSSSATSTTFSISGSSGSPASLVTVSSGYIGEYELEVTSAGGNRTIVVGGVTISGITTGTYNFKLGGGDSISATATGAGGDSISGRIFGYQYAPHLQNTESQGSFWLPSGTVINGTGTWRATVSLYNELS